MSDPLGVVGTVLSGKFRVERLLGEGGFGVVYAGTHLVLGTPIAVKLMKAKKSQKYMQMLRLSWDIFTSISGKTKRQ